MKKSISILLALLLSLSLAACGGGKVDPSDPNQGLWIAATGEMMGVTLEASALFSEDFTIELQSDGKCAISVEGEKANGTWTFFNGAVTVKGGGLDCSGTLKNGALTLENMLDMGMTIVFTKDGKPPAAAAAATAEETPAAPIAAAPSDAGYYVIESYTMGADTLDAATLQSLGMNYYIVLNEDGTMEFNTDAHITGTWEAGILHYVEGGEESYSEYTLDGDLLTIELASADVSLVFKRSSGAPPASGGAVSADASNWNELQRQWNGTWYGFMMFNSGTGAFEDGMDDWDMYMTVDVDAEGNGTFIVYDFELEEWARGTCAAEAEVLKVIEGSLTYSSTPMVPLDWTFYVSQDAENKIVNTTDFIGDDGDSFNNSLFFKPWGADWQDEYDSGRPTYPPSYEDYIAMVNAGEPSPLDGGSIVGGFGGAAEPAISTGGLDDVVVGLTFDELNAALEAYGMEEEETTPDDLAAFFGAPGLRDDDHSSTTFSISWYASDNGYATVFFDKETGFYTSWSNSGLGRPEDWEEGFVPSNTPDAAIAALGEAAVAGDGGPISYEVEGVTITATLPAAGWSHMPYSSDYLYIYNVPDASKAYSNDPRISVRIADNAERFDFYLDDFEDLKKLGNRTIGGVDMTGRTYKDVGMDWTEYIGKIDDEHYVSIKISKIDVSGGEGSAVLDSIEFR